MRPIAVIFYGQPGSGKGTQAELLSKKFGFIRFDTGTYLERTLHVKDATRNSILRRERRLFDTGMLCTPSWILALVKQATMRIAKSRNSIIYSGSPRTMFEAFGTKKRVGLMRILQDLYGKDHVFVVQIRVQDTVSIARNRKRLVCSLCKLPSLNDRIRTCTFCGGKLYRRSVDKPHIIAIRLQEYWKRTRPILDEMRHQGYRVREVNGAESPYTVFKRVVRALGLKM